MTESCPKGRGRLSRPANGCGSAGLGSGMSGEKGRNKLVSLLVLPPVTMRGQAQVTKSQEQEKGEMPHCAQPGLSLAFVGGWVL